MTGVASATFSPILEVSTGTRAREATRQSIGMPQGSPAQGENDHDDDHDYHYRADSDIHILFLFLVV
jgi:hypothetical protein